jgi:hypothetical protein
MIQVKYQIVGQYQKLFDAKRGKYAFSRGQALIKIKQTPTLSNFQTWNYDPSAKELTVTWTNGPNCNEEHDLFDWLELYADRARVSKC